MRKAIPKHDRPPHDEDARPWRRRRGGSELVKGLVQASVSASTPISPIARYERQRHWLEVSAPVRTGRRGAHAWWRGLGQSPSDQPYHDRRRHTGSEGGRGRSRPPNRIGCAGTGGSPDRPVPENRWQLPPITPSPPAGRPRQLAPRRSRKSGVGRGSSARSQVRTGTGPGGRIVTGRCRGAWHQAAACRRAPRNPDHAEKWRGTR